MPLIIVEGPRKSGKTHLLKSQHVCPVFKFDFNKNFKYWGLDKKTRETHFWGLGKEIMLHELNKSGHFNDQWILVDRGILTNSVWGVFQKRISLQQAMGDLTKFYDLEFFKDVKFLIVDGEYTEEREKDMWDSEDAKREEEKQLFTSLSEHLLHLSVPVYTFHNKFEKDTLDSFILTIQEITK
jgi:hypothetical protein